MHELGLCEAILDVTLHRAAGRRVRGIRVGIGGHLVDPEVIEQNIQVAAVGTPAEGLRVELVQHPQVPRCRDCGQEGNPVDAMALVACRNCGSVDIAMDGGDEHEVVLESITMDAPVTLGAEE